MKAYNLILILSLCAIVSCQQSKQVQPVIQPLTKAESEELVGAAIQNKQTTSKFMNTMNEGSAEEIQGLLISSGALADLKLVYASNNSTNEISLNKYIAASFIKSRKIRGEKSNISMITNDDDEQIIRVNDRGIAYNLNSSDRLIADLRITSPDIILSGENISLKIGDPVTSIEKRYPKAFEARKKISSNGRSFESILLPISEFSGIKSDTFIYVQINAQGVIQEIGSWEQY